LPTASWGSLLSATWGSVYNPGSWDPGKNTIWQTILPIGAITLTVLVFNRLGEALQKASNGGTATTA
jgi:ABC-type dipeptide/oligopeptide/nickel transport system permease subunit